VAAAIIIGIEENWTQRVAEGIAETGKPLASFSIEGTGDLETVRRASWKAKEFVAVGLGAETRSGRAEGPHGQHQVW
jgi:altronate dehydratase